MEGLRLLRRRWRDGVEGDEGSVILADVSIRSSSGNVVGWPQEVAERSEWEVAGSSTLEVSTRWALHPMKLDIQSGMFQEFKSGGDIGKILWREVL